MLAIRSHRSSFGKTVKLDNFTHAMEYPFNLGSVQVPTRVMFFGWKDIQLFFYLVAKLVRNDVTCGVLGNVAEVKDS